MRALGALAVAASLVITAACSGSDDEGPDAGPAPDALAEAVASLTDANAGRLTFQVGDDNDALIRTTGAYVLDARQTEWQMTLSNGERSVVTEQRRLGDRAWLRSARNGEAPTSCWQAFGARRAAERTSTQFEPPADASPDHPLLPHVAVATTAEGEKWVSPGSVVEGTADLYSVAATLGEVVGELDISPATLEGRAAVSFLLDDGEVLAWNTDVVAVLESLAEAGVELTDDMEELVETGAEIRMATGFSDLAGDVEVEAPGPRDICKDK